MGVLYSRLADVDYRWLSIPDCISAREERLLDIIIEDFHDAMQRAGDETPFCAIQLESCLLIGYYCFTDDKDSSGRSICAFEGIAVPRETESIFSPLIALMMVASTRRIFSDVWETVSYRKREIRNPIDTQFDFSIDAFIESNDIIDLLTEDVQASEYRLPDFSKSGRYAAYLMLRDSKMYGNDVLFGVSRGLAKLMPNAGLVVERSGRQSPADWRPIEPPVRRRTGIKELSNESCVGRIGPAGDDGIGPFLWIFAEYLDPNANRSVEEDLEWEFRLTRDADSQSVTVQKLLQHLQSQLNEFPDRMMDSHGKTKRRLMSVFRRGSQ